MRECANADSSRVLRKKTVENKNKLEMRRATPRFLAENLDCDDDRLFAATFTHQLFEVDLALGEGIRHETSCAPLAAGYNAASRDAAVAATQRANKNAATIDGGVDDEATARIRAR